MPAASPIEIVIGVSAKCFPLGDFIRAPHRGTPFAICTAFERRCRWRTPDRQENR